MMEGRTYVSLRINVLVGICVSGSTPRLTLNRVMSFSSAWIRVAVAERSSISFERVYSAIFLEERKELTLSIFPGFGRRIPTMLISWSAILWDVESGPVAPGNLRAGLEMREVPIRLQIYIVGIGTSLWVSFCEQDTYTFSLSIMRNMDPAGLISNSFIKFKLRLLCSRSLCLMPLSLLPCRRRTEWLLDRTLCIYSERYCSRFWRRQFFKLPWASSVSELQLALPAETHRR